MWSWKRKKRDVSKQSFVTSAIAKAVLKLQRRVSNYLNSKTAHFTTTGKKIFLATVCVLFVMGSVYTVVNALSYDTNASQSLKPESIHFPKHLNQTGEIPIQGISIIEQSDILKVRQFRKYMDSIKSLPQGKVIYDSLVSARPGLMDTALMVERLYDLQTQKH